MSNITKNFKEMSNITLYRVRHIPTGLFYNHRKLSETNGKIYRGENNIKTQCAHTKICVTTTDKELLSKYKEAFEKCGEIVSRNKKGEICLWKYICKPEDFEIIPLVTLYNI